MNERRKPTERPLKPGVAALSFTSGLLVGYELYRTQGPVFGTIGFTVTSIGIGAAFYNQEIKEHWRNKKKSTQRDQDTQL